jgi:uncharacterized protein YndB with AHSA1/START domain
MTAVKSPARHATLIFERVCEATVKTVFAAFADPKVRAAWGTPSETAVMIYDEADFRIGGRDLFRCGAKIDPKFRGETRYLDIVPNRRIVSSETIEFEGKRLSASLITVDLEPAADESTYVTLTVQLASFDGPGMIDGSKIGYDAALDNLVREIRTGRG